MRALTWGTALLVVDVAVVFVALPRLMTAPFRRHNMTLPLHLQIRNKGKCEWQKDWDDRVNYLENRIFSVRVVDGDRGAYRRELWKFLWDDGSVLGVWEPLSLLFKVAQNDAVRWWNERQRWANEAGSDLTFLGGGGVSGYDSGSSPDV